MAGTFCLRNLKNGRCLILLFGYVLGIVLGCVITLTFDFRQVSTGPSIYQKREILPIVTTTNTTIATSSKPHIQVKDHIPHRDSDSPKQRIIPDHDLDNLLFTALMSNENIKLNSIMQTWGQIVSKTAFFVSKDFANTENLDNAEVINLFESTESQSITTTQLLKVLKYLYDNHRTQYRWFLLANEKVYVNIYSLQKISENTGPRDIVYTGQIQRDMSDVTSEYCLGDAGILLSQTALINIGTKLHECEKFSNLDWDAGLGSCINQTLGLSCFKLFSKHFVIDKLRDSRSPDELWKADSPYNQALTIHPVVSSEHMYTLNYFFVSKELKKATKRVEFFSSAVTDTCLELPSNVLENEVVQSDCSAIIPEDKDSEEDQSKTEIKQRINYHKFSPADRYQYQHWQYFDPFYLYADDTVDPYVPVKAFKFYSLELKRVIQEAVKVVSKRHHPSRMKFKHLYNGYVRRDPLQGNEYIIDALFIDRRRPRKRYNERVRLLRPLSSSYVLQSAKNDMTDKVHIVVPISDVTQRCYEFLNMYVNVSLKTQESTHLVLVIFGDKEVSEIQAKVDSFKQQYHHSEITIVKGEGKFSRSRALHQGMQTLSKSDLAFMCDVDLTIDHSFWNRCRRNTAEGKMVYFPEVFKLYNPKFIGNDHRKISRKQGHWVNYGYGMLCIYKSDYDSVGGLNVGMMGWGGEDVDFYEKVMKSKLEILQSPDTGLIHRWHPNSCSKNTSKANRTPCINSRAEGLGDKSELAKYIYTLMEKHPDLT